MPSETGSKRRDGETTPRRLDRDVAALNAQEDDEEGSRALALFKSWMKEEQRRPLLLLDNLDIIFAGLKTKQWSLRRVLQEPGGVVVIGASAAALEAAADREGAFYDFFQVDVLAKLERHEILLCLRHMAQQREEAGRRVLQVLDNDPARIHVLYDLTGGNPRTLAFLYLVLETGGDDDVMRDLERLLDQATPLYKARVEELAPQTRVVFDALALAWDPATAADLAGVTGLDVGVVSVQLDRLVKDGVGEKTSLSSTRRTAFQVAERFFNIWYLMRHSSRRLRLRLLWLTEILRRIYSPRELRERATGLLAGAEGQKDSSPAYCFALSDALEDRELRAALRNSARRHPSFSGGGDVSFEDDLQPPEISPELGSTEEAAATYRKAIERNPGDPGLWTGLGKLLLDVPKSRAEAETAFLKAIEIDANDARPWNNLGYLLAGTERFTEAEAAFLRAIELNPKLAWPRNNLGCLLEGPLGRPAEAEDSYRKAIELDPKLAEPWNNLGTLLAGPLGRYSEAETALRKAIEINSNDAWTWSNLGDLLARRLGRRAEAEAAYYKAIEIDPKDVGSWNSLGNLLADHLFCFEEAEEVYRTALRLEPEEPAPLYNLANLLLRRNGSTSDAEAVYQKAVAAVPPHGAGLLRAFHALAEDNFGVATAELGAVLEEGHPELFVVFRIGLLRVLQFAAERGLGDKLLAWLKSSGLSDRYWPLYVALDAYLYGEGRLMDVNPEVRSGARYLLAEMTHPPSKTSSPTPEKKPRRKKKKSTTAGEL